MAYTIKVDVVQNNGRFQLVEKTVWHYANGGRWLDVNEVHILEMGGSGTSGALRYREEKTGAKQRCDTNECVFRKLKSGGNYSFRVQAFNRVGASDWSNVSRSARADTQPGRVQDIRMIGRDDGQITIAWDKPPTNTSRILDYTITWPGGGPVDTGSGGPGRIVA